jgi:membrane protease YdiL (CAAX protease family)
MSSKASFKYLIDLLIFGVIAISLGGIFQMMLASVLYWFTDWKVTDLLLLDSPSTLRDTYFLRILLLNSHLFTFLLPSIVFIKYFEKYDLFSFTGMNRQIKKSQINLSILSIITISAAVQYSLELNSWIEIPEDLKKSGEQAQLLVKSLFQDRNFLSLISNVIVVGIVPAVGEELFFRGIWQRNLIKAFQSPILGILLTSIIFSLWHMELEAFLPRVLLGGVLGVIYYSTGNLWYPIVAHFFNNSLLVLILFWFPEYLTMINEPKDVHLLLAIISIIITTFVLLSLDKRVDKTK